MAKPSKIPWPKILAEGAAIVVSILLAFGIDAWWSNRQDEQLVAESLVALRDELSSNLEELQHERRFRQAVIASTVELFRLTESNALSDENRIDGLLEDVTWGGRIDISTGAMVSILESGVLAAIEDGALKRSVSALPKLYDTTTSHEISSRIFLDEQLLPYMNRRGLILQIFNAGVGQGRPGGGAEMLTDVRLPTREKISSAEMLGSNEFLGLLALQQANHENVVLYYDRLEAAIERAITLIDARL